MTAWSRRRWVHLVATALVALALATGAGVLLAEPAFAHAQLESTNPPPGSVLPASPPQVELSFGEGVSIELGSVRVFGPGDRRVDEGAAFHPGGNADEIAIALSPGLANGSYVVAWRVISADSHPVHGAFIFSVATAAGVARAEAQAALLASESGSTTVSVVFWLVRLLAFAALFVLVGLVAVSKFAWPKAPTARRLRRLLVGAWTLLLVASLAGIALQGVYAAALPLSDLDRASLLSAVVDTRFGALEIVRVALLLAAWPLLFLPKWNGRSKAPGLWRTAALAVLGLGLLAIPGLSGHAATGVDPAIGVPTDVLHLAAISAWIGGLVLLAALLFPGPDVEMEPEQARGIALKVSSVALVAVGAVLVSGAVQAVRQVGSFSALFGTEYGRVLVLKGAAVFVMVVLGALSRRVLHGRLFPRRLSRADIAARAAPGTVVPVGGVETSGASWRLRTTVLAEIGAAVVVVALSAALVNSPPARQALDAPYLQSWSVLGLQVNAIIEPSLAGPGNQVHVYVFDALGRPAALFGIDATLSPPGGAARPLVVPLVVAGPGHYNAYNIDLSTSGTWALRLTIRSAARVEQSVIAAVAVR